jgi:geranylgeranyl diphosphate synthase type I
VSTLESRLATYASEVDAAAERLLQSSPQYQRMYDMHRYHLGWLDQAFTPVAAPPGKKLRPALCLLVAECVAGDWRPALAAATAVELIHNFSLIHDDIQDNSPLRRFRPTVWSLWGIAQGINAGDALLIVAEQALTEANPPLKPEVALGALRLLNATCRALCEGQYLDMLWEHEPSVTVEQYLEMIERKTARLFQCSAELGAFCAGASADLQQGFGQFASSLGLAFQAADDLLGIWSPEAETGKTADLDVANRKKSLPVVLGLAAPASPESDRLRALFRLDRLLTPEETAEATGILEHLGAREQAAARARSYRDAARNALDGLPPSDALATLREFVATALPLV